MNNHLRPVLVLLVLGFAMLACSTSVTTMEETPVPTSVQVDAPTAISITPEATLPSPTQPSTTPDVSLPQPLYFLALDGQSLKQVFRLERDGRTQTQLTFELVDVKNYDVSPLDGSIVYETNFQIIQINADSTNPRVLTEGGQNPVFSPDGRTVAYSKNGLTLYDLSTGSSNLVLQDQPLGGSLPPVFYTPDKYSPDGTKLLLKVGHPPDSPWSAAIYFPATNSLVPVAGNDPRISCCAYYGGAAWSPDSSSLYTTATTPDSSTPFSELWKVDANTGAATTLIVGGAGEGDNQLMYLHYEPYFAPDGGLNFFSAKIPASTGPTRRVPFVIVRTKPEDIINNWTILRGDPFELVNEALWAPDGSFVIVVLAPNENQVTGGQAQIVYFNEMLNVPLLKYAENIKWGR